ncbi:MAG: dTDP-4-dehydrorhamnose 3,5-epimerase [Gammaproteobacteria bacterium]
MMRFDFLPTPLNGLTAIQRKTIGDSRGFFSRFFCAEEFSRIGFVKPVAQINHSLTHSKGAVRGLHFQHPPFAEDKIVNCLKGAVFDVAVDLRKGSPTFLQWHGEILSAGNRRSLFIPQGFAHGFQALTADCELIYLHSSPFAPGSEGALNVLDPRLAISWPLPITELSNRDRSHPMIAVDFEGLTL